MKQLSATTLTPRVRAIFLAFSTALASSVAAPPVASAAATKAHYPKVLHDMVQAGKLKVVRAFPTDKDGLTGYIVKHGGYQTVVYSEDGYLMLGPLYGPEGQNLSKQYARKYTPQPDVGKIINALDTDYLVTQGPDGAPALYVFADPNCIFCHKLYQQTEPLVKAGKLRIHWIMVGVLGPSSVGRAAAILSADDPVAAFAEGEANFDVRNEQGGIASLQPSERVAELLDHNRQALFDVGGTATPTVLFRDTNGHWQAREGMPPGGWLKYYARGAPTP